ncbi:hypothetical protein MLD38_013193 [Melastoma candidum]|uniref:Uncharacterized protein n=1 Tax=Melastoma candidum TaxID=119954 RepID=A0ACB9R8V6_9MYRT|nr:hypothetical protein MLD38_013193 [Melastoma candidum]
MASCPRTFPLSRHPAPSPTFPPSLLLLFPRRRSLRPSLPSSLTVCCLSSGGSVSSDDHLYPPSVSTRELLPRPGFSVIANMLNRIDPLDNSVISKGVSESSKESMKRTISAMLGILPSDQFDVAVHVLRHPLRRLLISSIITGYTLWNAEYRMSLMRNFNSSSESLKSTGVSRSEDSLGAEDGEASEVNSDLEGIDLRNFTNMPPEAATCIQELQSELQTVQKELKSHKQRNMRIQSDKESSNDLLEYLRSLDSHMVNELSHPSSVEVEEIIRQLVSNILKRFFEEDERCDHCPEGSDELHDLISTSRDNLAKLLFWCMLLGHHLRGLENRLQLSCVVGLL